MTVTPNDLHGRPYAKLSLLCEGMTVKLDGDFTCCPAGPVTLRLDKEGLYFPCAAGHHYLDGQLQEDCDTLIGVYPI